MGHLKVRAILGASILLAVTPHVLIKESSVRIFGKVFSWSSQGSRTLISKARILAIAFAISFDHLIERHGEVHCDSE